MKGKLIKNKLLLAAIISLSLSNVIGQVPVTPGASPEARALLNYLYSIYGKKTLSGQMWAPWGNDEIKTVFEITGKYPAIRGMDYIHKDANDHENQLAIEWWKAGGIPTIMWHWGAPSKGEGYEQSKMGIDIDRCFEPGTEENKAMWSRSVSQTTTPSSEMPMCRFYGVLCMNSRVTGSGMARVGAIVL